MKWNKPTKENVAIFLSIIAIIVSTFQYIISKQMYDISNYVEVFVMPENVVNKIDGGVKLLILKVKNMSNYPIYLNSYVLDGKKNMVGNSPIPNNEAVGWYEIGVPSDILNKKHNFDLDLLYEDYFGRIYKSHVVIKFVEYDYWNVTQEKSMKLE